MFACKAGWVGEAPGPRLQAQTRAMRRADGAWLALVLAACAPAATPSSPHPRAPEPALAPEPEPAREPASASASASAPASASASASAPAPASASAASAPPSLTDDALVRQILARGGKALAGVLAAPEKHRFQALYGVVRNGALERRGYRADVEYFFPASSMKMPITLATYERLAALRAGGRAALTRDATLRIHPATGGGEPYVTTLARETWRALIVSDNLSANRLLSFVGHREAHETLWGLGLASTRIRAGFATGGDIDPAEVSPKIDVTLAGASDELPARRSDLALPPNDAVNMGIGDAAIVDGRRVEGPLSFADKNAIRLRELQDTLVRIMRPELLPSNAAAGRTTKDDVAYVRRALGTLPSESSLAGYDRNVVQDYRLIPFLRGIERVKARGKFEIYSKVGQAYGFLIGNAYVVDKETGRSFFLIASVFANPDGVMNDDNYGYDDISFPALADVAEVFTRHAFS